MIARGTPGVGTSRMCERHPAKCFSFIRSLARSLRSLARSFGRRARARAHARSRVLSRVPLSIALKRAGAAGGSLFSDSRMLEAIRSPVCYWKM